MSANNTDVARIHDEDVLRRMWQETEDFGRKKEIRSHMYKLREARLKDFYNSADVSNEVHQSTTTTSTTENISKTNMSTTHADSLADQSYVTLKSKEVRDSESPTRDSYNKTIVKHQDQGWKINTCNERSIDGKTQITAHTASTAGTQEIEGGKVDYAAKIEEKASVFQDGDDKNFTKAVGTSSSSAIRQEASGGDENSNFRSSSSKTSSSSRYVSESKNTSEDIQPISSGNTITKEQLTAINEDNAKSVVQKTYTTNIPSDLKSHPSYVEGKTKVTQVTKTLDDGTIITTTQYETKHGNSTQTATHKKYSNIAPSHLEQKSSSSRSHEQFNRNIVSDTKQSKNDQNGVNYNVETGSTVDINLKGVKQSIDRHHQESRDTKRSETISNHQTTKTVRENIQNEQINRDTGVKQTRRFMQDKVEYVEIPLEIPSDENITTRTTTTKTVASKSPHEQTNIQINERIIQEKDMPINQTIISTSTTTKRNNVSEQLPEQQTNTTYYTTSSHSINQNQDLRDSKSVVDDHFISTERQHEVDTRESVTKYQQPLQQTPREPRPLEEPHSQLASKPQASSPSEPQRQSKPSQEPYMQPEKRQPIKPGKSELDQRPIPTDGQYETTYRNDYTNKKISVEVSATHDAFARSLRSVTPERITRGSPRTGSNASIRSTSSPEKMRHPSRVSPDRHGRSKSPKKNTERFSSSETITYKTNRSSPSRKSPERYTTNKKLVNGDISVERTTKSDHYSTDTITSRSKIRNESHTDTIDSSTLTRRKNKPRSPSPTGTTTSDFEYVRNAKDVTTDLDITYRRKDDATNRETSTQKNSRPSSLEITTKKSRKVTERSPTSPLTEVSSPRRSPTKDTPKKEKSPSKEGTSTFERPKLIRTDTYEERVKEILGLSKDTKETRRSSLERSSLKRSSFRESTSRTSNDDITRKTSSPTRDYIPKSPEKQYPKKKSPVKELRTKSPEKPLSQSFPDRYAPNKENSLKKSPEKESPSSQTRRSPERVELGPYLTKQSPSKTAPTISEFPSQIRKSPEKEQLEAYPERKHPTKSGPSICEFPSQIRKSPERERVESYPEKKSPTKYEPSLSEFPSQVRRLPQRQSIEPYPERSSPPKSAPTVSEFPSQVRKSPERQPLEPYPEKQSPTKSGPAISEFPSQIRKSPQRLVSELYSERSSPSKSAPTVSEFPSQIRRSPTREPLEPYPEKNSPPKSTPTTSEFPAQIRRSPDRQILEPYPERSSPIKSAPTVSEFPSQIRRSPAREPLEPYPEKKSPTKSAPTTSEFPAQIRKSPERHILERYPEKSSPSKSAPNVSEFPSQIRRSPVREPLEPYPERRSPTKSEPTTSELPAQIRKSPERQTVESYLEKTPSKGKPVSSKCPSQIKISPEREFLEQYPERKSPRKYDPTISEFPSQARKTPEKEPLETYPEKSSPSKSIPTLPEFPSQTRKSPDKTLKSKLPDSNPGPMSKNPISGDSPKSIIKTIKPSSKSSKMPNRVKVTSESSTTTDEEDIEDKITETVTKTVQSRVPAVEPIVEKKAFSQLCREDEITTLDKKKTTRELIENEILENQKNHGQISKTVKKQKPTTSGVWPKEVPNKSSTRKIFTDVDLAKTDSISRISSTRKEKSPIKKPIEKTPSKKVIENITTTKILKKDSPKTSTYSAKVPAPKKQEAIYRVEKTKFIGGTEYQNEFSRANKLRKEPVTKLLKPGTKTTLYDIEQRENTREDKSIHLRSNRVDDTVTKKKVTKTILVNGDAKNIKHKESPAWTPSSIKKTSVNVSANSRYTEKISELKPKQSTAIQSRYSTSLRKEANDIKPKGCKPVEPKKHLVNTKITICPETGPKINSKNIGAKTIKTTKTKTSKQTRREISNGYHSSDTDEESIVESIEGSFVDLSRNQDRYNHTTTDQIYDTVPKEPVRGLSKPALYSENDETTRRVVTTKTVLITNEDVIPDREFIVNLQRSKSSREPTPDRLCPRPLTSDEEEEASPVRYPDQISEPDDGSLKKKPKKLSDIPIFETEDNSEYSRITDITDTISKITKIDKVEETDESLLSVNKKINKFLNTADQLTKMPLKPKPGKVARPNLEVSEDLKEDECLLSVSDKVSKFINTAEQLTTSNLVERPKSPRPSGVNMNIQKKVFELNTSVEESTKPKKTDNSSGLKVTQPDHDNMDNTLKKDECLLSVSDKVSKFISTAEKLTSTSPTKPVSLSKIEVQPKDDAQIPRSERKSPTRITGFKPDGRSSTKDVTTEFIHTERKEEIETRKLPSVSPERHRSPSPGSKTPNRRPSNQYNKVSRNETSESNREPKEIISPKSTPKSPRGSLQEDFKPNVSSTTTLRSTESIKKAKALFENIGKEHDNPWQKDILSRPSVFDSKRSAKTEIATGRTDIEKREETTRKSLTQKITDERLLEKVSRRSQSPQKSPERSKSPDKIEVIRFRPSSPEKVPEIVIPQGGPSATRPRSREPTPDGDLPHYMKPLDRSLRPNSPHRDSMNQAKHQQPQTVEEIDTRQTKFGVTLRRTDSGRTTRVTEESSISTSERRRSSITFEKRITEEEIEEIFQLEILEELLEKVVGYELRRKIRTQIRLVKKLISEGTLEVYISKKRSAPREAITRRGSSPSKCTKPETFNKSTEYQSSYVKKASPERRVVNNKLYEHTDLVDRRDSTEHSSEYQSSYSYNERRSSTECCSRLTRKSVSPVRDRSSPQKTSPERKVSKTIDVTPGGKVTTVKTTENIPGGTKTTTTKTTESTFTTLKKTTPPLKKLVEDNQPEWVRQRNLKNAKERPAPVGKKVSGTMTSATKKSALRTSPAKELKGTDLITSSYGVGPTDENGAPLFGLKALRAQNKNEKTKVQGTVIRSEYYSENDQEPVGQVSVTKYSTDPGDLEQDGVLTTDGNITSITTTQKFGYKDTPSLRSLNNNRKEICDKTEKTTTKTTKVNRRGSVKEMSKKFIDNAVETLKSERQTTYPKAGLILRSSSFKSTNGEAQSDSRESSPADDRQAESSTVTVRTMRTSAGGDTFLTNKNKISGAQDVITRMKNEDYEEGDTEEDIAARGLLNKFIGAQVILSGMEASTASSNSKTTTSSSPSGTVRRSTKITTTITEGGKPTTTTRVFQRPVSEKELETVWDEQSLRLLLEQSSEYEERRIIRVRLRQVMAEQEACTALVDEATKDEEPKTPTTPTTPGQLEGESQLLPLLQGLLDAPENDITPDSGTESGEDQRTNLIAEVQTALEKLSNSLKSDQTDITPERRTSLLQLVTKLQAGLSGSTGNERRASTVSVAGRFQKRKNKQARHTVGVSKEELADARKLIEQISLSELTPSGSTSKLQLSKQNSESSVPTSSASSSYRSVPHKVKNAIAKPFSSSNSTTSSVQTPTEHFDGIDVLFNDDKEIIAHEVAPLQQKTKAALATTVKPGLERNTSVDSNASIKSAYKAVQQAAATKVAALRREQSREQLEVESEFEEEDESSTMKGASDLENASLKSNPIYSKPSRPPVSHEEKSNRFDTQRKMRMKRANTIDIPKPLNFYEDEDESESEHDDDAQKRRDSYYALRGPINVSNPHTKKIVPSFEPKTDSDKKFLAFINKHNENSANKGSMWGGNSSVWGSRFGNIKNTFENTSNQAAKTSWQSADDTIKKSTTNQFGPKISRRSARNLQQMFEEKQKECQKTVPRYGQIHVRTDPVQNDSVHTRHGPNVITGTLQVKTETENKNYRVIPQPLPVNQFSHAPQSAFKPIKKTPQSPSKRTSLVFSPDGGEILKSEIKDNDGSSFLYSPKPISSSVESSTVTSPVASKPWAATTSGNRVLNLAASKFEQPPPPEPSKPRKLSREPVPKVFTPTTQVNTNALDRTPTYLAKNIGSKSNTVRKLSGHYENHDYKAADHQPKPQTYQVKTSVVESQYTQPVKHYEPSVRAPLHSTHMPSSQNYSIKYDQPPNYNIRYDEKTHSDYTQQPQRQSILHSQNQSVNQNRYHRQQSIPQNYSVSYNQPCTQQGHSQAIQPRSAQTSQQYQPQNYSIRYDQQQPSHMVQNYSIKYDQHKRQQDVQAKPQNYSIHHEQTQNPVQQNHVGQQFSERKSLQNPNLPYQTTQKYEPPSPQEKEYTSTCEFKPSQTKVPIQTIPVQAIEPVVQAPKIQRQISDESVHEYNAVSSRVMSGPISQQAITVRQKSPMNRDQHDMEAAFSLKNSLQMIGKQDSAKSATTPKTSPARSPARSPSNSFSYKPKEPARSPILTQSFKYKSEVKPLEINKYKPSDCPKPTVSPSSFKFKTNFEDTHREARNCGVVKPMQQQKHTYNVTKPRDKLVNQHTPSVITGQFHIPVINVKSPESPRVPVQAQTLSKSDSWHEICMAHQNTNQKPVPKPGPVKSKSSHTLAVPKMFEAGMSKEEMLHKRRTMEAFLTGSKSPSNEIGGKTVKRSINRVKTSQKVSTQTKSSGGLTRSRTLPDMVCPDLLDESNVDRAFDELFESS